MADAPVGGLVVLGRVEVLLVVEELEADVQRAVAHIGLREAEHELAAHVAQVALQTERFAQAQEVVGLVVHAQEGARQAADAAVQADRVLALFLHLQQQVNRAGLGILVGLGVLIHLQRFEVLQLVQAQQAVLPQLGVVDRAFVQHQFAADDLVAGDRVALELDARDIKRLAFVDVDIERDGLLLFVEDRLGNGAEVDIAQLAVSLLEVLQAFADQRGVEPLAVFHGEGGAQRLFVGHGLVAGEGDGAQPVAGALFNRHQNVDALALVGAEGEPVQAALSRICVFGSSTAAL